MEKPVYNSSKKYTWKPEDKFVLKGEEFGLILNAIRSILNTPEAAKILLAKQANDSIENVFAKSVENGIAQEVTDNIDSKLSEFPKAPEMKLV